jgi:hypothetical protein
MGASDALVARESNGPEPDAHRQRRSGWVASVVIVGVIVMVTFGGYVMASLLSTDAGHPATVGGLVSVSPLSGWEASDQNAAEFLRLSRGNGTLDVIVAPSGAATAEALATTYADDVLRGQLSSLEVSSDLEELTLAGGIAAVRFSYVGVAQQTGAPIEGEVTSLVAPSGAAIVFDAWAPEGLLPFVQDDVRTMVSESQVS